MKTSHRLKRLSFRLCIASIAFTMTFALLCLALEGYLYARNPSAYASLKTARSETSNTVFDHRIGTCFAEDDILPFSLLPGTYAIADDAMITINSHGYRGGEFNLTKPPSATRILFVGDSFTYGYGVNDDETIPFRVEQQLAKQFDNLDVINAGFHGSGMMQYDLYLRTEGYALDPDIIVLVIYTGNDIEDINYSIVEEYTAEGVPARMSDGLACYQGSRFHTVLPGAVYHLPLLDRSAAWHYLNRRLYNTIVTARQSSITREQEVAFFARPLLAIIHDTHRRGIKLEPWVVVGREMLDPDWYHDGTEDYETVKEVLDQSGVDYLDLLPMLAQSSANEVCLPNDLHLNAQGNAIVANAGTHHIQSLVVRIIESPPTQQIAEAPK